MLDRNKISGCCETVISVMAQHIDHLETMIQISYDDRARLEKALAEAECKNRQLAGLFGSIKELIGAPDAKAEEALDKLVSSMQIKSSIPSDPFDEGCNE